MRVKIAFICLALLLTAGTLQARGFTGVGVKGGMSMTGVTGNTIMVPSNRYIKNTDKAWLMRGGGGFFALYNLNRDVYLQGDLLYMMKGGEATQVFYKDGNAWQDRFNYEFDYLQLPVVIKYVLEQEQSFKPSVFTGPSFGYMLKDLVKIEYSGKPRKEYTIKNVNKFDFSWIFGIDANIPVEKGRIVLDMRYHLPFTNFATKPAETDTTVGTKFVLANQKDDLGRNTGVQAQSHGMTFMVGYVFDLPKKP